MAMSNGGAMGVGALERHFEDIAINGDGPPVGVSCERLYVSGLPRNTSEQDLQSIFSPFGQLTEVQIHRRSDGTLKGSGCVSFANAAEATMAYNQLRDCVLPGASRPIVIKHSTSTGRRRDPRSFNGGNIHSFTSPAMPPHPPTLDSNHADSVPEAQLTSDGSTLPNGDYAIIADAALNPTS